MLVAFSLDLDTTLAGWLKEETLSSTFGAYRRLNLTFKPSNPIIRTLSDRRRK